MSGLLIWSVLGGQPVVGGDWTEETSGDADPRLKVESVVRPGRALVGEAVDLSITVDADAGPLVVETPRVAGAEVIPLGEVPAPAEGRRRLRFRMILRRPGGIRVPPVVARAGSRSGRSRALEVQALPLPAGDRPPGFLGGVGEFTIEAIATPARLRVGQSLEYSITVKGPAALGIDRPPGLDRLARLEVEPHINRQPDRVTLEPPSRTFAYQLRPTRPGPATIPPVTVSMFEPRLGRYVTRATAGLPITVLDADRFEHEDMGDPKSLPSPTVSLKRVRVAELTAAAGSALIAAVVWQLRRRNDPSRVLRGTGRALNRRLAASAEDDVETQARVIVDGLIEILAVSTGRPAGALTPSEAEAEVRKATGSESLAGRARELLNRCDRIRFDRGGVGSFHDPLLREDGRALLAEVVRAVGRRPTVADVRSK